MMEINNDTVIQFGLGKEILFSQSIHWTNKELPNSLLITVYDAKEQLEPGTIIASSEHAKEKYFGQRRCAMFFACEHDFDIYIQDLVNLKNDWLSDKLTIDEMENNHV